MEAIYKLFLAVWLSRLGYYPTHGQKIQVNTTSGIVEGQLVTSVNIVGFLGIPYAMPPIGARRFKYPDRYEYSSSTIEAKAYGPACMQPPKPVFYGTPPQRQSEDCLTLNVFRPIVDEDFKSDIEKRKLSVMVWIHGGAYIVGTSEQFPGEKMAEAGDVIIVTINYRLGVLGFLTSGDDLIPGNMGLMDQRLALQWVGDNIGQFGGDPQSVTVFGQSAGGMSISLHMLSPQSQGLFHRAICQSGVTSNQIVYEKQFLKKIGSINGFASVVGCPNNSQSEDMVKCLQSKDLPMSSLGYWQYEPIVDGEGGFLPEQPSKLWKLGNLPNVDFMTGVMKDEGMVSFKMSLPPAMLQMGIPANMAIMISMGLLEKTYPAEGDSSYSGSIFDKEQGQMIIDEYYQHFEDPHDNLQSLIDFFGDVLFTAQTQRAVKVMSSPFLGDSHNFLYYFTHKSPDRDHPDFPGGPSHADDLQYLFENDLDDVDENVSMAIIQAWTTFAKYGYGYTILH